MHFQKSLRKIILFGLFLFVAAFSFTNKSDHSTNLIIDIQPFSGISKTDIQYVFSEIKKVYPFVELKATTDLPRSAYYPQRNRYRADSLINFLSRQTVSKHVTIGITASDISATKESIADWGVIGLGFCPGNACIASTFRLAKNKQTIQLFKVALHELGHTQGLPHCSDKSCFMRDAEGKNPADEEKDFCTSCKAKLIAKGWKF
jgi:archaemetzincin